MSLLVLLALAACTPPDVAEDTGTKCIDATWYPDGDGDGFGTAGDPIAVSGCDPAPVGYVLVDGDCDDVDPTRNPAAAEVCNGIDEDCDGEADEGVATEEWYADVDGDGYGGAALGAFCAPPESDAVTVDGDCDDEAAAINPAAAEACNSLDDNCDGTADEGVATVEWYVDADGDGYGGLELGASCASPKTGAITVGGDCDDTLPSISPAATETCNGIDDNCDGTADEGVATRDWYADADGDGFGATSLGASCAAPTSDAVTVGGDCNDATAAINPAATETCDGVDQDCDGAVDDGVATLAWYADGDGDGYGAVFVGASCSAPSKLAVPVDGDCDDAEPRANPGTPEICGDEVDNNCDGAVDEGCSVSHCGTISTSETWDAGYVHRVTCSVNVDGTSAPTLTIEDGAIVEMSPGTSIYVAESSYGKLVAAGSTLGIVITSSFDEPAPGDWGQIWFGSGDRGSSLNNVELAYGGGGAYGMVVASSNHSTSTRTVLFDGVTFASSSTAGLYVNDTGSVGVTNSTFVDNLGSGLYATGTADLTGAGTVLLSTDTFTGNAQPAEVPPEMVRAFDEDVDVHDNTDDAIVVSGGTVSTTATWPDLGVPFELSGRVLVEGATPPILTLADGVEIEAQASGYVEVGRSTAGGLVVDGAISGVWMHGKGGASWAGLLYDDNTTGSSIVGLTLEDAGNAGFGAITYTSSAAFSIVDTTVSGSAGSGLRISGGTLTLTDSTFADNAAYGIYSDPAVTFASEAWGLVATGNGSAPIHLGADDVGKVPADAALTGNGDDQVEVAGDTVSRDAEWVDLGLALHVVGSVVVSGAGTPALIIDDGVELRFATGTALQVGDSAHDGRIDVNGDTVGVVMTSDLASAAPGDWYGVILVAGGGDATFTGLELAYGGRGGRGAMDLESSSGHVATFTDCVIHDSSSDGLYVYGGQVEWSGGNITDNAGDGIHTLAIAEELLSVDGAKITGNDGVPIHTGITSADAIAAGNDLTYNGHDVIQIAWGTSYADDVTWANVGVPYELQTEIEISTGDLTLAPGVILQFDKGTWMRIIDAGGLTANGTATDPILFTSSEPSPAAGDWGGLGIVYNGSSTSLSNFELRYGGGRYNGSIYILNASPVLADGLVADSSTYGIYRDWLATPSIVGLTYASNAWGDVY